jgi:hypothetical protein
MAEYKGLEVMQTMSVCSTIPCSKLGPHEQDGYRFCDEHFAQVNKPVLNESTFVEVRGLQHGVPEVAPQREVRITDPTTGGQKGSKLARFSLIPRDFLWALAEHYGKGAQKYDDRNWERGYKWSLTLDALDRHLNAWLMGEDDDPETGSSHLIAVAWHVIALWWFHRHGKGTDDVRGERK